MIDPRFSPLQLATLALVLSGLVGSIHGWSSPTPGQSVFRSRRAWLLDQTKEATIMIAILSMLRGSPAVAEEANLLVPTLGDEHPTSASAPRTKPFAPIEKLLPATRVKWTIGTALNIVKSMDEQSNDDWKRLEGLLLVPQNYTNGQYSEVPTAPAKAYLDTYQRNRENLQLLAKPGAILVQSGEISAWKRLKRQEYQAEQRDEIRAALNLYTSALNYNPESYLLNVPSAERKQMIRQDRLPDIKQVIQSDMGLRYLYRNELLTAMQQVRDEVDYQLSQPATARTKKDLVPLLESSQSACNEWFSLIDPVEVADAMKAVGQEKY